MTPIEQLMAEQGVTRRQLLIKAILGAYLVREPTETLRVMLDKLGFTLQEQILAAIEIQRATEQAQGEEPLSREDELREVCRYLGIHPPE